MENTQENLEKITQAETELETKLNEYEGEMTDEAKQFLAALGKTTGILKEILTAGLSKEDASAKFKEFYQNLDDGEKSIFSDVPDDYEQ